MKIENNNNQDKQETEEKEKIVLPEELQKSILKFFLKTSIPRKIREDLEKAKETLPQEKGQDEW